MRHKDLRIGQIIYILVFYNISFSWLLPLDGFQSIFLLRDSEFDLLFTDIIKVVWCQREILLLLSFVPHGMYGTPQIKLPTKSSLQHTLRLQTRAWNLNKKLLRANGRCKAAKKEFTGVPAGSYKFISLVQARQIGSANDDIFFPQAQIIAI